MMRRITASLLTVLLLTGPVSWWQVARAESDAELTASQAKLAEIERQIEAGLRDLRQKQIKAGSLAEDLARLDDETRQLALAAKRSLKEMQQLDERVAQAQQEHEALQEALQATGRQVRKRLATLYKSGEIGLARIMLGTPATPAELAENHTFLARMVRHDRQLINDYRQQAAHLEERLVQLQALREQQSRLNERNRSQHAALEKAGQTKRKLLAEIRKDEALLAGYLEELRVKAARLGELVKKLETDLLQPYTEPSAPFAHQKGLLTWPIPGPVRVGFGTVRNAELGALLESNGLEITAPAGSPVKAIWSGKVLFASPFRGYGKLIIIDHGDKYYSLYAQVADFTKQVGEEVLSGETVAYSGFEGRDFLYFEIRRSGKPIDPMPWLKGR